MSERAIHGAALDPIGGSTDRREANEAALVKRELVDLQRSWLRAIDAAGVYVRAVAAGRPTSAPFSALMRASRTERAMESRLRTEWGL